MREDVESAEFRFRDTILRQGRRRGSGTGEAPAEIARALGLDWIRAEEILRAMHDQRWFEPDGDGHASSDWREGVVADDAPRQAPSLSSAARDGRWGEDRYGHRCFKPGVPEDEASLPRPDSARPDDSGREP